jgi:hypothetical protein
MVIIYRLEELRPTILFNIINFNVTLRLCSPGFLSPSDYLNKDSQGYIFLIYLMRATCPAYIILQFITLIFGDVQGSKNYEAPRYAIPTIHILFNLSEISIINFSYHLLK